MRVKIISATAEPMRVVSLAAGTSYGKDNVSANRVKTCFNCGHLGVFEHASVTLRIDGVSRCLTHQLVRHRLASFVEMSQRYVKLKLNEMSDWYVTPMTIEEKGYGEEYRRTVSDSMLLYVDMIRDGVPAEDARYVLPQAVRTSVSMTVNARELFHFLDLRTDERAQWEIRNLAEAIENTVKGASPEWAEIMGLWEGR